MKKISGPIYVNGRGQVGAFDNSEQVPELQNSIIDYLIEAAQKCDIDLDGMRIDLPDGSHAFIQKYDEYYAWDHHV